MGRKSGFKKELNETKEKFNTLFCTGSTDPIEVHYYPDKKLVIVKDTKHELEVPDHIWDIFQLSFVRKES